MIDIRNIKVGDLIRSKPSASIEYENDYAANDSVGAGKFLDDLSSIVCVVIEVNIHWCKESLFEGSYPVIAEVHPVYRHVYLALGTTLGGIDNYEIPFWPEEVELLDGRGSSRHVV